MSCITYPLESVLRDEARALAGQGMVPSAGRPARPYSPLNFDRSIGAVVDTTSRDGCMGQEAGVEAPPATATPEKVEDGEKDCNVPDPSSEGGPISGTAESLAPCAITHTALPPIGAALQPEAGCNSSRASSQVAPSSIDPAFFEACRETQGRPADAVSSLPDWPFTVNREGDIIDLRTGEVDPVLTAQLSMGIGA